MPAYWTGDGSRDPRDTDADVTRRQVVALMVAFIAMVFGICGLILWVLS